MSARPIPQAGEALRRLLARKYPDHVVTVEPRDADEPGEHPGMTPRAEWEASDVHRASTYSCGKCGRKFDGPHDLYDHLDAEHPTPRRRRERKEDT